MKSHFHNTFQVAAVVVAVHQHARLRLNGVQQQALGVFPHRQGVVVKRLAQMTAGEPLGKQIHYAGQQRLVVGRQAVAAGCLLS